MAACLKTGGIANDVDVAVGSFHCMDLAADAVFAVEAHSQEKIIPKLNYLNSFPSIFQICPQYYLFRYCYYY